MLGRDLVNRRTEAARARFVGMTGDLGPELLRYFERRVPDAAEDLLSEVLIVGWRRRAGIPESDEQARMWFYGVARNVLRTHARSHARRLRVLDALRGVSQPAAAPDASEHIALRDAVERLPPDLREVIELAHWEQLTLTEIAQLLGIPASTVRGRYQRARERLALGLVSPVEHREHRAAAPPTMPPLSPGARAALG